MSGSKLLIGDMSKADTIVLNALKGRDSLMLERTIEWSSVSSGSYNIEGLERLAPMLVEAFSELNADVSLIGTEPISRISNDGKKETFSTGPVLRVRSRNPESSIHVVMTGHYDTVFAPGAFEDIKDLGDGRVNGPGLADMKGGICVMLEALRAFEMTHGAEEVSYEIVLSPDEEIGNFASDRYIREAAKKAHIGLTFEPAMESGAMAGARKSSAIYDVIFRGKAAHAGRNPQDGRNSISAAAELTLELEKLDQATQEVTINVGKIDGGGPVNIVPDLAVVRFGVRAENIEASENIDIKIRNLVDKISLARDVSSEFKGGFYRPAKPKNKAQRQLISDVQNTARVLKLDLEFVDTGGVCEGNNVFAAGTPNIDTLGVRGGNIHSTREFLVKESLVERASLAALILNRIADGRIDAHKIKKMMETSQ